MRIVIVPKNTILLGVGVCIGKIANIFRPCEKGHFQHDIDCQRFHVSLHRTMLSQTFSDMVAPPLSAKGGLSDLEGRSVHCLIWTCSLL